MKLITKTQKPYIATLNEVIITRKGDTAIIEYKKENVGSVHLKIGNNIDEMTDEDILECHNNCIHAQLESKRNYNHIAVEIPPGKSQVKYFEEGGCWTPRGDVLRCEVDYSQDSDETVVIIDDKEFSMLELGKIISTYEGWGMRITFVPEDEICQRPNTIIKDPDANNGSFIHNGDPKKEH